MNFCARHCPGRAPSTRGAKPGAERMGTFSRRVAWTATFSPHRLLALVVGSFHALRLARMHAWRCAAAATCVSRSPGAELVAARGCDRTSPQMLTCLTEVRAKTHARCEERTPL